VPAVKATVVTMFMSVLMVVSGCIAAGFSREGTIVPVEEPVREARASAVLKFNEATGILQSAYDRESGKMDAAAVDRAIELYKEAERLCPELAETQLQLGLVYEFFKNDANKGYAYYKKYKELGGTNKAIISTLEEAAEKREPDKSKEEPGN
jgi:hypothetical protein